MKKIKLIEIAAFFAFTAVVVISMAGFEDDCKGIRNACLRLHVIANSNSQEDQALKLKVRDAVLESGTEIFGKSATKEDAEKIIEDNISALENAAEKTVAENGYDYNIKIEVGKSYFPTKTYDNFTLPAGQYDAVRVIIGSGSGKNWWCVMFPTLCLPCAKESVKPEDILNSDELKLVTSNPKYEIRFWLVEKYQEMKQKLGLV